MSNIKGEIAQDKMKFWDRKSPDSKEKLEDRKVELLFSLQKKEECLELYEKLMVSDERSKEFKLGLSEKHWTKLAMEIPEKILPVSSMFYE